MEQIKSFEQYRKIVSERKNLPEVCPDCYFLPTAMRDKIDRGALFTERMRERILILEREQTFFSRLLLPVSRRVT